MGPGENAGAVDVGDGWVVAFKVESHNHPSAVEPFQGAATGVGGILRDIFAIGARPIAVLDSLRFGEPSLGALALPARPRGRRASATTATRSACRRSAARSTSRARTSRTASSTRWRSGWRERDGLIRSAAAGRRQRARPVRRLDRPRRDRRRVGAGSAELGEERRGQAPDGPGRRPVRGEEAARVLAGAARARAARRAAGPRRRGADVVVASEMASKGEVGLDIDVARCRCARPAWSRSRSWSPSRRSGCSASSSPTRVDEVLAVCEKWEVHGDGDRRRSPTRARCACFDGDERRRRHAGRGARRRLPALRPRARAAAARRCTRAPPRAARAERRRRATRCSRCSPRRTSPRAGRSSSSTTASCSRARCAAPSRPTPRCCALPGGERDRGLDRRQRAPRRLRPVHGRGRGGARVRGEPRLRRRRAARPDELPELRQPREAAHRLAADRGGPRPGRRLPRARTCRSSAATSRSTTRAAAGPIYPTPVVGMVGELPDAARAGRLGLRARGRRDRARRPVRRPRSPAPSSPSCAASALPDGLPERRRRRAARGAGGDPRRGARRRAVERARRRRGRPRASRSPSAAWPAGIGATLDLEADVERAGRCSSARRPAASSSPGPREARRARSASASTRRLRQRRRRRAGRSTARSARCAAPHGALARAAPRCPRRRSAAAVPPRCRPLTARARR